MHQGLYSPWLLNARGHRMYFFSCSEPNNSANTERSRRFEPNSLVAQCPAETGFVVLCSMATGM